MTTVRPTAAEPIRFRCRTVAADGPTVARVREEFGRWLRRCTDVGESRLCDVILAVNEALANAAEFAYPHSQPGAIDLEGVVDDAGLIVSVADDGSWRSANLTPQQRRCRGRGIPLMRLLADGVAIDARISGTSVRLRFNDVRAVRSADTTA